LLAVIFALVLQMVTIYVPILNGIFKTEPLTLAELAATLGVSSVIFFAVEMEKWFKRKVLARPKVRDG
jgi:Ca2+-transporting ATPase